MSRVTPPQEHLDYLQQVGVDILTPRTPSALAPTAAAKGAPPGPEREHRAARPVRARAPWPQHAPSPISRVLIAFLVFILFLALLAVLTLVFASGRAHAAPPPTTPATTGPRDDGPTSARAARQSEESEMKRTTTAPRRPRPTAGASDEVEVPLETAPTRDAPRQAPSGPTSAPPRAASASGPSERLNEPPAVPEAATRQPWSLETFGVCALVALAGSTLFCQGHLDARMKRVERTLFGDEPNVRRRDDSVPEPTDAPSACDPPGLFVADSPPRALDALVAAATARGLSPLPRAPRAAWGAGIASITGNVRPENQDAAIAFEVGGAQVIVVADGLGGLPRGQEAARLAVGHAALSAACSLAGARSAPSLPQLVAGRALLDAAAGLSGRALAAGYGSSRDGFRTTLIVVVATPESYGYAYLGDGGGVVLRASGAAEAFLVPQKSEGLSNVVAGSLGPVLQGSPVVGTTERRSGDVLLVGTDGVFDRVPDTFATVVSKALEAHGGDAQQVAALAVADLADAVDGTGYICDDNLSFGILCTPAPAAVAGARRRAVSGRR